MKKSIVEMILEFIRQVRRNRRWQRAVTCVAALVVFVTTYALILPAITMEGHHPHLAAEALTGWAGDPLSVNVSAESPAGSGEKVVALTLTGEEAGLSEKYEFDENGVTSIIDAAGQEILLHRTVREDAKDTVDYWFVLAAGQKTDFTLELEDEIVVDDVIAASGIIENVRASKEDKEEADAVASASNATAVVEEFEEATASNAAKASVSNALKASASNTDLAAAVENDEVDVDEDSGEILDGAVIDDIGAAEMFEGEETEVTAALKVAAGSGDDLEAAIRDAEKNAEKRGDASLGFTWRTVANTNSELTWAGNGVNVSMYYNSSAEIPDGAYLSVVEIEEGSDEYQGYLDGAAAAVNENTEEEVGVASARFFDITILDADGNEIQPASQVVVKINYDNAVELAEDADIKAVHFAEEGAQVIDTVAGGSATALDEVAFNADHFSVYGVITYGMKVDPVTGAQSFSASANGVNVEVKAEAGAFPEGAYMKVERADSFGLRESIENAAGSKVGEITAVDITFYSADGTEIQPAKPISVVLTSDAIKNAEKPMIVHVEDDKTEAQVIEEVEVDGRKAEFTAEHFSIYAVVEAGSTDANARATVNFYGKDTTKPIATVYVKNSDDAEQLEKIIYDPGAGALSQDDLFAGWNISTVNTTDGTGYTTETESKTVEDIRKFFEDVTITEGDVYNIYAMIFKHYSVQFKDEDGVTLHSEVLKTRSDEPVSYTVNTPYTPKSQDSVFFGWNVTTGSDKINPAPSAMEDNLYPNGTSVTISGDVIFSANPAKGFWISYNENGDGVSYTPPEFVETDSHPTKPSDPSRVGYTFGGWYTDAACTEGNEFNFDANLSARTTVYAKWTPVENANYTVIIWQESMQDTYAANVSSGSRKYDFYKSYTLTGTTNATITAVSDSNRGVTQAEDDTTYYDARVQGSGPSGNVNEIVSITGYHKASYDTDVTIAPEGTSVVNVYYDRNTVTYTFYTYQQQYSEATYGRYGLIDDQYVQLYYYSNRRYSQVGNSDTHSTVYYVTGYDWRGNPEYEEYQGTRYSSSNSWAQYQKETGLYGETLNWPTDSSIWWYEGHNDTQGTGTRMTYKSAFLPLDADMSVEYWGRGGTGNATIHFWTQDVNGGNNYTDTYQVSTTGGSFSINDKFTGFTAYQYRVDNSGNWQNVGTLNPSTGIYGSAVSYSSRLDIRYNRITGTITFLDGKYFNGDGVDQEETRKGGAFKTSEAYFYQADVSSYNSGGADYYTPDTYHAGYTFAGWYADDSCTQPYNFTTMPATGITVYAKWVKTQYRVFMHPNVDSSDTSLDWGGQPMCFRVDYGLKIAGGNNIYGTRDDYDLIGWYTDEACTNAFNFDAYTLNDSTVTAEYDKTQSTELDKYGNPTESTNKDATNNRFWITRKLDLYAKWRSVLDGAKGIDVVYDAGDGVNAPIDTLSYLDNSEAVAGAASTPNDDTQQFLYWVLQTWDGEKYVDTDTHVYPGDSFVVLKADAHKTDNPETTGDNDKYLYTVQLRAQYGPKEVETPTHITWYDNFTENPVEGTNYITDDNLQINQAVRIEPAGTFTRDGYKFLGWAKVPTNNTDGSDLIPAYEMAPQELDADDLFLVYENGKFTYNGTEVSQVAADEVYPYHDLYAVWEAIPYTVTIKKVVSGVYDGASFDFTADGLVEGSFNLVKDGTKVVDNVVYGTEFSLEETEDAKYSTTIEAKQVSDENGTDLDESAYITIEPANGKYVVNGDMVITVTNTRKTIDVIVKKTLDNPYVESKAFSFTASAKDGETEIALQDGDASFDVISGTDGHTISGVPVGAEVTIVETKDTDYDYTTTMAGSGTENKSREERTYSFDVPAVNETITFTNSLISRNLTLTKKDSKTDADLSGAKFVIKKKDSNGQYAVVEGLYSAEGIKMSSGTFTLENIPSGDYSLVEEVAPDGYVIASNEIYFTVNANDGAEKVITVTGSPDNAKVNENDSSNLIVTNTAGEALPHTGGRGTLPLRIAGLALMLMGAAYVSYDFKTRRRRERRLKK